MAICSLLLILTLCMLVTYHVDSFALPYSSLQCRLPHGIGSCKIRSYPTHNTPQSLSSSTLSMSSSDAVTSNEELDIDGTISSWSRLISAMPKLKRNRQTPPDELDKKILSTALPTMLNLMVVPLGTLGKEEFSLLQYGSCCVYTFY